MVSPFPMKRSPFTTKSLEFCSGAVPLRERVHRHSRGAQAAGAKDKRIELLNTHSTPGSASTAANKGPLGIVSFGWRMDRFDRVERTFGISACCCKCPRDAVSLLHDVLTPLRTTTSSLKLPASHEGFAALVKARYSDFIVHEIDRNGNVACLDCIEVQDGPTNEQTTEISSSGSNQEKETPADGNVEGARKLKRKLSDVDEDSLLKKDKPDGETAPTSEVDWDNCGHELSKLVNAETSKEVVSFLRSVEVGDNQEKKFFTLPAISDKEIRRSIHMLIKSPLFSEIALADNHEGR